MGYSVEETTAVLINFNMGCFEMQRSDCSHNACNLINFNMGCFEIVLLYPLFLRALD